MNRSRSYAKGIVCWSCGLLCLSVAVIAASDDQPKTASAANTTPTDPKAEAARTTVEAARRQAELLHSAMHSTLQTVHHKLYRNDEGLPLPAAVLTTVFAELEAEQHVKLRWLAVEGQAMNVEHKPKDEFETQAVQALKAGQRSYEETASGVYRRAAAITLTNQCLKCHLPDRKSTEDRTAGLIVAIPVRKD